MCDEDSEQVLKLIELFTFSLKIDDEKDESYIKSHKKILENIHLMDEVEKNTSKINMRQLMLNGLISLSRFK